MVGSLALNYTYYIQDTMGGRHGHLNDEDDDEEDVYIYLTNMTPNDQIEF